MKRLFCWIVIGVFGLGLGSAKADTIFSFYGLGDMARRIDARSRAMGGAGRALVDGQNFSTNNPALIGAFARPSASVMYLTQRRTINGGNAFNDGDVGAFQVVIPLAKTTILSVGFDPLTDVDFGAIDSVGTGNLKYQLDLDATGGVQAVTLALGHRYKSKLFLGARIDWVAMGTINEIWEKTFQAPDVFYSRDVITKTHRGWMPSLGVVYTPSRFLSVAGNVQLGRSIRQRQILTTRFVSQSAALIIETKTHEKMPYIVGSGVAYQKSYRWLWAADVERAFWEKTGAGRYNTWDLSTGILFRTGNPDPFTQGRRIEFNAGLHYRTLYFPTASGSQIGEIGASVGVALPFKNQSGRFRYGLEIGKRGDRAKHGASENFVMQTFSITGIFQ